MKTNQQIVEGIYAAFAQGNVPFILENVAENFTWQDPNNFAIVPHGGIYSGRTEFLNFFRQLDADTATLSFDVSDYATASNLVVAIGQHSVQAKKTGKPLTFEWTMVWRFENGVPVSGRSYYDTASAEKIYQ